MNQWIEKWSALSRTKRILILAGAALVVVLVLFLGANHTYSGYRVVSEFEQKAEESDRYDVFGGWIVQYGNDGITCYADDGTLKWSTSYEISQPILAKSTNYLAIGDMGGNVVYLFDTNGYVNKIETTRQIFRLDVSDYGAVAAILQSKGVSYLELIDVTGSVIADGEAHIDDSGYPISIALTADGETMAVAYMSVAMGRLSTKLVFYHFGSAGGNADHIVASFTYNNLMIPKIAYIANDKLVAFGDTQLQIYSGGSSPKLDTQIEVEDEILSVFYADTAFGIVCRNQSQESADASAYQMTLYTDSGAKKYTKAFDLSYNDISVFANGEVCIQSDRAMEILTTSGHTKFHMTFEERLKAAFATDSKGFYDLIFEDRVERVKLR